MKKKKKKDKVKASTQKKQRFSVGDVHVRILVMPWKITSETGTLDCAWMEALVYKENGFCVRGVSVCNPIDEFDFRLGAELALKEALKSSVGKYIPIPYNGTTSGVLCSYKKIKIVKYETRKAIWNEFNRLLPK